MASEKLCGTTKPLAEWMLVSKSFPSDATLYFKGKALSPQTLCLLVCDEEQYQTAAEKGFFSYVLAGHLDKLIEQNILRGKHIDFAGVASALNRAE